MIESLFRPINGLEAGKLTTDVLFQELKQPRFRNLALFFCPIANKSEKCACRTNMIIVQNSCLPNLTAGAGGRWVVRNTTRQNMNVQIHLLGYGALQTVHFSSTERLRMYSPGSCLTGLHVKINFILLYTLD